MSPKPLIRRYRITILLLTVILTSFLGTSGIVEAATIYTVDRFPFEVTDVRVGRTGRLYEDDYRAAGITGYKSSEYHPAANGLRVSERGAIDFQVAAGTPIYAIKSGIAVKGTKQCQVAVLSEGVTLYYIHLKDVQVKVGQSVVTGQYLGKAANTCGAQGAHLHLAAWKGNKEIELRFSNVPATKSLISQQVCPATLICPSRRNYVEFRYSGAPIEQTPEKPKLLAPANNSQIRSQQVTIKWADPPGYQAYSLYVEHGGMIVWANEPANDDELCPNGVCQVTLTELMDGSYRWHVMVWGGVGSATSDEWLFTIAVGETPTPTNTSTSTPLPTPSSTPTVTETPSPTYTPTPTQRVLPPNLISNPGFEQEKAGWTFVGLCSQAIYTASSGWLPYDGAKFLAFAQSTDYPNCTSLRYDVSLSMTAGQQYTGAVCLRGGHGPMPADVAVWGVGGGNLSGNGVRVNVTSEWQCIQHIITAQYSGHTILRLEIYPKAMNMDIHVDGAWLATGAHQIYP